MGESAIEVLPAPATLGELAATAEREHALVMQAGQSMVLHAIAAGEALLAAREQVPLGEWEAWVKANSGLGVGNANIYMRIARHQERVRESGVLSINAARRLLRKTEREQTHPELAAEAKRLKGEGVPQSEIADIIGVSREQVTYWVNPASYRKRLASVQKAKRRRAQQRKALERQERDAAMRKAGGSVAESYSHLRRALQALERAIEQEDNKDARREMHEAMNRLHLGEDYLVKAVRLS